MGKYTINHGEKKNIGKSWEKHGKIHYKWMNYPFKTII